MRQDLLEQVAIEIAQVRQSPICRVAIDGVDGAGKTVFADELGRVLVGLGKAVIRASADGFHNPPAARHRRGRDSPDGFYRDSYDYATLRRQLLDPLGPEGNRRYRRAVYDALAETPVDAPEEVAAPGSVLLFDGIFLHRPELREHWDYSIFLEVGFDVSIPRGAQRGIGSPDPGAPSNRRYVEGQRIYLRECDPAALATILVNNENLAAPRVIPRFPPPLQRG